MMKFALFVLVLTLIQASVTSYDTRKRHGKAKILAFKASYVPLASQFSELKYLFELAEADERDLVVIQSKNGESTVEGTGNGGSYNLCDVFVLPDTVSCTRAMKLKCPVNSMESSNSTTASASSNMKNDKKRLTYYCGKSVFEDINSAVSESIRYLGAGFRLMFIPRRQEEVNYVQNLLGLRNEKDKVKDYNVVHWIGGDFHLGNDVGQSCDYRNEESTKSSACGKLLSATKTIIQFSLKYCIQNENLRGATPTIKKGITGAGMCYLAGATKATPSEVRFFQSLGLQTFLGIWIQNGLDQLKINEVSMEVMELGLMLDASKYLVTFSDSSVHSSKDIQDGLIQHNIVEFERMTRRKDYCLTYREWNAALPQVLTGSDKSWCQQLSSNNFVYSHDRTTNWFGVEDMNSSSKFSDFIDGIAISLLWLFSSRFVLLGSGFISVITVAALVRFCYFRTKSSYSKSS